jgi:hypothetical protein
MCAFGGKSYVAATHRGYENDYHGRDEDNRSPYVPRPSIPT